MNEEESYFYTLLLLRGRNIKRKNHFIVTVKEDLLFEKCINFLLSKNISFFDFHRKQNIFTISRKKEVRN